jgi:hypothetical protein
MGSLSILPVDAVFPCGVLNVNTFQNHSFAGAANNSFLISSFLKESVPLFSREWVCFQAIFIFTVAIIHIFCQLGFLPFIPAEYRIVEVQLS